MGRENKKAQNRSKKAFVDALIDCLDEKRFEDISVREICKKSTYSTVTFYNHWQDKYDLAMYIIKNEAEKYFEINGTLNAERGEDERLERYLRIKSFLQYVYDNRRLYYHILNDHLMKNSIFILSDEFSKLMFENLGNIYENILEEKYMNYSQMFFKQTTINHLSIAKQWMDRGFDVDIETLTELFRFFMQKDNTRIEWKEKTQIPQE